MNEQRKYLRIPELRIFKRVLYETYPNSPSMILRFVMMYEMGMRRGEVALSRVDNLEAFVKPNTLNNPIYNPQDAIGFTILIEEGGGRKGKTKSGRTLKNGKEVSGGRTIPTSTNFKNLLLSYVEPIEQTFKQTYGQPYDIIVNSINALLMRDDMKGYLIFPQGKTPKQHIHPHTLNDNMKRIEKLCRMRGLKIHLHPHILRHTFAIHYLHHSANPSEALIRLQKILGHSSLNTTAIYLQMSMEDDITHYDATMENFNKALDNQQRPYAQPIAYDSTIDGIYSPKKEPSEEDYRRYERMLKDMIDEED